MENLNNRVKEDDAYLQRWMRLAYARSLTEDEVIEIASHTQFYGAVNHIILYVCQERGLSRNEIQAILNLLPNDWYAYGQVQAYAASIDPSVDDCSKIQLALEKKADWIVKRLILSIDRSVLDRAAEIITSSTRPRKAKTRLLEALNQRRRD